MSSLKFTSLPKKGEIPKWVAQDLVGLHIGLCTPQKVLCIGLPKLAQDIADMHNALAVSPDSIIFSLKRAKKERAAEWFDKKFKYRHTTLNGNLILISTTCCEYEP